jgi:hydroxymethylpyrimidine/phosphomethylpyrimidine kinase
LRETYPRQAVKIGMLANGAVAEVVADFLETVRATHVVLDPVCDRILGQFSLMSQRNRSCVRDCSDGPML